MTQTISVNAIARELLIPREECEWVEHAYLGEPGSGKLLIHDAAGTVVTTGHKTVIAVQDASTPTRLYTGYVGEKTIRRGEYTIGASRWVEVTLNDLNTLLARKVISGTDGKRSAETPSARLTWLLASDYLTGLVSDYGAVTYGTAATMDKNDYRGQKPGDVLAAIAKDQKFNYYVRWHAGSAAPELVFRDDNVGTADASTLRISNVAADVDSTVTFAPIDAALTENPDDVYSGAYATYAKGAVYSTRAATATAFVARDGVTDDSGIKTSALATTATTSFLSQSRSEEHTLSLTIRVRAAQVNLVRAGDRIQVKLSHLATEGYGSFTWFRVLRRRVTQPLNTDNDYDIALDLSPQEAAEVTPSLVQVKIADSAVATAATFDNPVTVGNLVVALLLSPQGTQTTPEMQDPGWTQLGAYPVAYEGATPFIYAAAWAKIATSTDQVVDRETTGPTKIWVGAWEIANASIAGATVYSQERQPDSPLTIGTLSGPGFAVMSAGFTRGNDQTTGPTFTIAPGTGWTERLDSVMDGNTGAYYADGAIASTAQLSATAVVTITGGAGQSLGEWVGFAVVFNP